MEQRTQFLHMLGQIIAIIGCQWGDEGKGKLVDILAEEYDIVVRATGGANAGHTIYLNEKKFVFHLVPSGVLHEGKIGVIGNGCVIHIPTLVEEIEELKKENIDLNGRLWISEKAHLVLDYHRMLDALQEEQKGGKKIGTTQRGIGPAYTDKMMRIGIRVGELLNFENFKEHYLNNLAFHKKSFGNFEHDDKKELIELEKLAEKIQPFITETFTYLKNAREKGKKILLEGANGTLLDIDHGTYPFVTSSNASIGGIVSGSSIAPTHIKDAIGIVKAYTTRVGSGPFPTELLDETGEFIRQKGGEFGATTGRPRRCGWFDAMVVRYACELNGITAINITKLDVLSGQKTLKIATGYQYKEKNLKSFAEAIGIIDKIQVQYEELAGWDEPLEHCRTFNDLPKNAQNYVKKLAELVRTPIKFIGVGHDRKQMITL